MAEIRYVNNICRACLGHEGEFRSVFVPNESSGLSIHFADMIMSCTSLQIAAGDGLPEQICSTCALAAAHFYLFKQRCEESDRILRRQFLERSENEISTEIVCKSTQTVDKSAYDIQECSKLFDCNVCLKTFDSLSNLDQHTEYDHSVVIAEEKHSIETFLDQELIPDDLIAIKSEEIVELSAQNDLKCEKCNKKFSKVAHLNRHFKIHSAVKQHHCKTCNKEFPRLEQYYMHMNGHSGIKPHVCHLCNKGFNQLSNLKDHMRTHNGEKPFLCSICGKGFNQLGNLRQHNVRHSGVKSHVCSTCGNGFASKGELCAHLRKHTGARPFVCSVCGNGFTTSSSLTKHKRIHSGEKPYECEVCKMKFSRSGILARHKRTHTGEKPYVCKYCSKAFSQSNDLCSHLRIHTGEKPYICDVCGQAFRQSSALKTHKKTHADRSSINDIDRSQTNFVPIIQHTNFLKNDFDVPYGEIRYAHMNENNFIP